MAAPAFRSKTDVIADATNPLSVTKPAGTADGDALLLFVLGFASGGFTLTTPSGWTLLHSETTSNLRRYLFWKSASSEGASYSLSASTTLYWQACMLAYSGADATPIDVSTFTQTSVPTTTTTLVAPSVTTTVADTCHVVGVCFAHATSGRTFTPPAGYTERSDFAQTSLCALMTVADATKASAGATGTQTFTASSAVDPIVDDDYFAISVALKPGAAAGATFVPRVIAAY